MHASSGIRTQDPSNQTAKTYALDGEATGNGMMAVIEVEDCLHELCAVYSEVEYSNYT
jgi:hypothetical protein